MKKKALLVFTHQITENQEKELQKDFKVEKIEVLPYNLQEIWSNVRADSKYMKNLYKIKKYIKNNFKKGDILLIQGNW
ncbi:MAG: CRISPR-associated protein Csx20 [Leptotrichiaceae bacterium]|nr:CRISPR-associated protein Csx20 [Leptotrichiaceae bacterium]